MFLIFLSMRARVRATALTQHAKSGGCACSVHAKSRLPTKSGHSMFAINFDFIFELVILENPGIDPKIMGVV